MNILVTGAGGFVGQNLVATLEAVKAGKDRFHKINGLEDTAELNIFQYDINSTPEELNDFCKRADFVFNLAGVNRPENPEDFMKGNFGFASTLLDTLKKHGNKCPVMLSSSIQASLLGRYAESDYGKSKLAGEELFAKYSKETGAPVYIYRFANLYGKWCRPNYNSAVATFCNNKACGLPITVNDRSTELELVYIDDLVDEMVRAINGKPSRCEFDGNGAVPKADGNYCFVPVSDKVTLGEIVDLLDSFVAQSETFDMPSIPQGSFAKKLYSTYLSYLPEDKISYEFKTNSDDRGSFTELVHTLEGGQMSVNISKPGITKGQHWHHSKWELFIVVKGEALMQQRRIGVDRDGNPYPVVEKRVSGAKLEAVHMLPGYTHNIINLSETEELITLMWCNEKFEPERPDTYFEPV